MMKPCTLALASVFALAAPAMAQAAMTPDRMYFEGDSFLDPAPTSGTNLVDAKSSNAPTLGPTGLNSPFTTVGQRVNLRGAVTVATDAFSVTFDTPGLRFVINELTFYENGNTPSTNTVTTDPDVGGTLELSFDNSTSATFDADDMLQSFAFSSMDSPLGFSFDNMDGSDQLIAYDVDMVATPIPGALLLFGTGIAGLAGYRFRRANTSSA
jgi:hypothetical protein